MKSVSPQCPVPVSTPPLLPWAAVWCVSPFRRRTKRSTPLKNDLRNYQPDTSEPLQPQTLVPLRVRNQTLRPRAVVRNRLAQFVSPEVRGAPRIAVGDVRKDHAGIHRSRPRPQFEV